MPHHANQTSFKRGHKPSPEAIEKHRAALQAKLDSGWRPNKVIWTEERKQKRRETARRKSLGSRVGGPQGYMYIMTLGGYRYEHRVVMEQMLGHPIPKGHHVHHRNGDRHDNRPENLELLTHSEHARLHYSLEKHRFARKA